MTDLEQDPAPPARVLIPRWAPLAKPTSTSTATAAPGQLAAALLEGTSPPQDVQVARPPSGPSTPRPDDGTPRTRISSRGEPEPPDPELTAELIGIVLGLLAMGASLAVRRLRRGRDLRQPTNEQLDAVADPLGAIAARHLPKIVGTADLRDGIKAGRAVRDYLTDGDLIRSLDVSPGVIPPPDES